MLLVAPVTSAVLSCNRMFWTVQSNPDDADEEGTGDAGADRRSGGRSGARARRRRHVASTTSARAPARAAASSSTTSRAARASSCWRSRPSRRSGCSTRSARGSTRSTPGRPGTRWRDAVLAHYGSQPHWGCPIGALSAELRGPRPEAGARSPRTWTAGARYLRAGIERMAPRPLRATPTRRRSRSRVFASLHGGLLLTQTMQSLAPLEPPSTAPLAEGTDRAATPSG